MGVEFSPLQGWDVRHFGLLWERFKDEYPKFEVKPPLAPREYLGPEGIIAKNVIVEILGDESPPIRGWFIDQTDTRLIQVQEDRFIHNWRKVVGDEAYPHYNESIRPTFVENWMRFLAFLDEFEIERPVVEQWEVTYVNHFEKGREWNTLEDLPSLFPSWTGLTSGGFLPPPAAFRLHAIYPIEGDRGRLRIAVQPVVRVRDKVDVLQVRLTASGETVSSDHDDLLQCLDLGREWVVQGFTDITSADLHRLWERKERS